MNKPGFTLTEILVSLTIFSVIGIAMLQSFNGAIILFNGLERQRIKHEEGIIIDQLLRKDVASAIALNSGGHFLSILDPDTGNCYTGWSISRNNSSPNDDDKIFVLWGIDNNQKLRRAEFTLSDNYQPYLQKDSADPRYFLFHEGDVISSPINPGDPPELEQIKNLLGDDDISEVVSQSCLHFSIALIGNSHLTGSQLYRSTRPFVDNSNDHAIAANDYWTSVFISDGSTNGYLAEPNGQHGAHGYLGTSERFYCTALHWDLGGANYHQPLYPRSARFTCILSGTASEQNNGTLRGISNNSIDVVGLPNISVHPGTVLRIGNSINNEFEWVGIYSSNGVLMINSSTTHGPIGANGSSGRALFRTEERTHSPGTEVASGQVHNFIYNFTY